MKEKKKEEKVISKNTKGTRKKDSKKNNQFKRFINLVKNHKIIWLSILVLVILCIITLNIINYMSYQTKVITINKNDYTKSDFAIYLYSAKFNYFDNVEEITEDDLNVIYDEDSKMTVKEYLKEVALSDIKTAASIKELANKYDISLSSNDLDELDEEKETFIKNLGGKKEFKKLLKENNTTEDAYDKMAKTDKLYKKVLNSIFAEGKINDLTGDEIEKAKIDYESKYFKIKQVILTIIDVNTGKSLTSTTINQKETLANNIVEEAKKGTSFDELIKKYSEDAIDKEGPYDLYYKTGELLTELENKVLVLKPGEVSKPIKTKYAYHIIEKQKLDNGMLDSYYDELREEKCIEELKVYLEKLQIVYHDAYEKIKIK